MDSVPSKNRFHEGLRLAVELCDGLSHLYARGIAAHRDLKPENCLLSSDGHLKVTDFGIASLQAPNQSGVRTLPGGSPAYMPPEQFYVGSLNQSADVYSFGILLFELLTGRHPFARWFSPRMKWEQWEQLHQKLKAHFKGSELPDPIQKLLSRCFAKDYRDRYQNFAPIREVLAFEYLAATRKTLLVPQSVPLDSTELELKAFGLYELNLPDEAAECLIGVLERDGSQDELYLSYERVASLLDFGKRNNEGWSSGVAFVLICGLAVGRTFIKEPAPGVSEAIDLLETIVNKNPGRSSALEMKARVLLVAGRYKSALPAFREAILSKPGDEKWRVKLTELAFYQIRVWTQELPHQPDSDVNITECCRLAAELGNPDAQYLFGLACLQGKGVELSPIQSFVWLFLASRNGNPESLRALEEVFEFLQKNENFQLDTKRPSALAQAKHNLGSAYFFGNGTQRDYKEAAKWFREAAEMGLADSRYNLGLMYRDGQGVEKDLPTAYVWLSLAAGQGDENALAMRNAVGSAMSPTDWVAASALAQRGQV